MVNRSHPISREHHFVPQFYLRRFSSDGKRINLFNFSLRRAIVGASIKHQCSRRNFYGFAPKLEETFSAIETHAAGITRQIISKKEIPPHSSGEWSSLLSYVVFQKLRTTNAAYMTDAMTDYVAKMYLRHDPEFRDLDLNNFVIKNVYAIAIPLKISVEIIPFASDLRGHLFINQTKGEFVASDDPVVTHNQYCEGINYRGVNGWNCRGLQVFWPVSPDMLVLLYDPVVYKVGMSHRGRNVSFVTSEADVRQLNGLQILNASKNIYFANEHNRENIKEQCRSLLKRRPSGRVIFAESQAVASEDGTYSALLHTYSPLLPIRLSLSLLTIRTKARRIPLHERSTLDRHPIQAPAWRDGTSGAENTVVYPVKSVTLK